ncbi:hypothetical protein C8A01DRAFT_49801 [Parachaetomium inaequale]|uniref:Uncharacterized protein n=1 Tax=Parachaetomium inaequale TaxID=2588326 RepID=A0AAN6P8E8_9PEZI|nr:hypothetical protein C8A01DRAFT_49801 [Parachaetomium inaequale]
MVRSLGQRNCRSWYGPGGLHPTHLGDTLSNSRYTIVHKLDHSNHSLSWLTRDSATNTWRRIDIVLASPEVTKFHANAVERDLLAHAADAARADARGSILELLHHRGPNCDHLCMVFPLNGTYNCFRWTVQGGGRDKTEMNEAWLVRQCAKLRKDRAEESDGSEAQAPENVHAITAEEMLAILGRPRLSRDDQVPRYLVLRPDRIEEDFDFWLSEEAFQQ